MLLSGLKCLGRLERQVKFAKNRCCKIKPVAVTTVLFINDNSIIFSSTAKLTEAPSR